VPLSVVVNDENTSPPSAIGSVQRYDWGARHGPAREYPTIFCHGLGVVVIPVLSHSWLRKALPWEY
jgi:hypothetical protein